MSTFKRVLPNSLQIGKEYFIITKTITDETGNTSVYYSTCKLLAICETSKYLVIEDTCNNVLSKIYFQNEDGYYYFQYTHDLTPLFVVGFEDDISNNIEYDSIIPGGIDGGNPIEYSPPGLPPGPPPESGWYYYFHCD